jgi:Spy/CpxP family protein refolding chaperone
MTTRIAKTLLTAATIAALAIPAAAQAKNGADDPAGHARHTTTTQTQTHHRHRHGHRHTRRADDTSTQTRRSQGTDDTAPQTRRAGTDDPAGHR